MSVGDQVHEHVQGQLSVVCMMNSHQAKLVDACLSHLTSLHGHSPSCLYDFGHRTNCGIGRLVSFKERIGVIFVFGQLQAEGGPNDTTPQPTPS